MGSWLQKKLSRDRKTKPKDKHHPKNNGNIYEKKKNNGKYNAYHRPLSQKVIVGRHYSLN